MLLAQEQQVYATGDPLAWLVLLAAFALLPFLLVILSPFAKLVVVFGLVRTALGTQNVPPNTVVSGLAMILSIFIMMPVVEQVGQRLSDAGVIGEVAGRIGEATGSGDPAEGGGPVGEAAVAANGGERGDGRTDGEGRGMDELVRKIAFRPLAPLYSFLLENSDPRNLELFASLRPPVAGARTLEPASLAERIDRLSEDSSWVDLRDVVTVVAPAFILTELTEALQIAFLIFVPFAVIDIFVSTTLLALGMTQMPPTTIALPLKLLLFVLMDGWSLIIQGLLLGYTVAGGGP